MNKDNTVEEVAKNIVENHYNEDMDMNTYPSAHKLLGAITEALTTYGDQVRREEENKWKYRISKHLKIEYEHNTGITGTGRIICERLHKVLLGETLSDKSV